METRIYTEQDTTTAKLLGVSSFSPSSWGMCFLLWESYIVTIDMDGENPHLHVEMDCLYKQENADYDYKSKESRLKDCEYFVVYMSEDRESPKHCNYGGKQKIYACTAKNVKVTWFDEHVRFEFYGVADQNYEDAKFRSWCEPKTPKKNNEVNT